MCCTLPRRKRASPVAAMSKPRVCAFSLRLLFRTTNYSHLDDLWTLKRATFPSTLPQHLSVLFRGKLSKIIMFSCFFCAFSLVVMAACCSCGSPLSSECRGNTLNLNDCILVMMDVCSCCVSDSGFTLVVLYLSFYFLFSTPFFFVSFLPS